MFEAAELGSKVAKKDYEEQVPQLRVDLLNAQFDLRLADFPVLLVIVGDDRRGCSELVNLLNEWMDARHIRTCVFGALREEERERPRFWRYWRALPSRGEIGIFTGDFAVNTIVDGVEAPETTAFDDRIDHMERFERALRDDGALVLKFWLHIPRDELKKRLKKARKSSGAGRRFDDADRSLSEGYGEFMRRAEEVLRRTDPGGAPWTLVESSDHRHRNLIVAQTILAALTAHQAAHQAAGPGSGAAPETAAPSATLPAPEHTVLDTVDLSAQVPRREYREQLRELQAQLGELAWRAQESGVSSVLVFEGWDAAGKGGVIRRLTGAMDVQHYRIVSVAAPTDEERAHHYLWRFWRQIPGAGNMRIFDRSWYGRVLVERVEDLAREAEWQRAYAEINDFEEQLVEHGVLVFKFWLHIDPDEQLARFQARQQTPYKKHKLTDEDYRNRERWGDYALAVNDMVARTSTDQSPWKLVAANDKRWARLEVLRTVCGRLSAELGR